MGISDLTTAIASLYREIATTSVRFEGLERRTEEAIGRIERAVEQAIQRVAAIHDDHVRETAALEARLIALEGRLTALSERALHIVMADAAREAAGADVRRVGGE
jgi:hypothetical protein